MLNIFFTLFCCCIELQSFGWLPGRILPADDSLVPFFGVVDRFLPPSGESQHDQLYHVTFEDGDGEEYFENELHEVMTLYDEYRGEGYNFPFRSALITDSREWRRPSGTGKSGAKQWTKLHPSVGIRVCKYFTGSLSMLSGSGSGVSDSGAYGGGDGTNVAEDSSKVEHDIQDYMEEAMAFQAAEMGVSQEGAATATIAFSSVPPLPDLRSVSSALPPASVRTLGSTYTSSTSGSVHTYDSTSASLFSSSTEASTATSTVALSAQVNAGSGAGAGVRAVSIADFFRGVPTHGLTARPGGASNPAAPGGNVSASVTGKRSALVLDNLPPPAPPAAATESKREIYLREQQAVKRKMMEVQSAKKGRFNWSTLPIPASPPSSSATASAPTSSATDGATPAAANRKQNVIKKKKAAETDTEDAVPVSVPGPVRNTAPVRANTKCVNAANTQMVTFIDECLSIMQRHRSTMEAAKQNALNSCQVVPQEFANKLVEAMAGDIILVVSQSLNPKSSTSSSSGGGAGKETRES